MPTAPPPQDRTPLARLAEAELHGVVGYQLAQATIVTTQVFNAEVGAAGKLRPVEYTVLALIHANPGVTARQLAKGLAVTPPNIAVWLDRLQSRGLVARSRSDADARMQHIRVTRAGARARRTRDPAPSRRRGGGAGHVERRRARHAGGAAAQGGDGAQAQRALIARQWALPKAAIPVDDARASLYSVYRVQSMTTQLVKLDSTPDLVDQVYRVLLDAISEGTLAPGERITQEDIAERLAVSRQPVLQALRLLKKDGFVLDAPGRGVLVAPLDALSVEHVYQVRVALDALAARLAAARRARLDRALIDNGRKASRGKSVKAMIDADIAFHNAIYAASGNPWIEQSAHHHWRHLRRVMGAVLQQSKRRATVWDEHEAIAAAIAAGDAARAARLIEQHGQRASDNLADQLAQMLHETLAEGDKR